MSSNNDPDFYTQLSKATGVDRESVKKVIHGYGYMGEPQMTREQHALNRIADASESMAYALTELLNREIQRR